MTTNEPVDFLIIGAGKSGTTSLYYYLGQHPEVFLSPIKEPRFFLLPGFDIETTPEERAAFSRDFPNLPSTRRGYDDLFRDAKPGQLRGEASIQYLTSEVAAANIGRHAPSAKLICILRNPMERAFSNYSHAVRDKLDPHGSLLAALEAEGVDHFYFDGGFYGRQLQSYAKLAPENPLRIWLYEELDGEPVRVVQEILDYLELDSSFVPDVSFRANVSGEAAKGNSWAHMYDWARRNRFRHTRLGRRVISPELKKRVVKGLAKRADATRVKRAMSEAEWQVLYDVYRDDIEMLEGLLGRDLASWRQYPGVRAAS